jgi:hypothetical protein
MAERRLNGMEDGQKRPLYPLVFGKDLFHTGRNVDGIEHAGRPSLASARDISVAPLFNIEIPFRDRHILSSRS